MKTKYKVLLGLKPNIVLLFDNNKFLINKLNIPYIKINNFDYNTLFDKNKLFDEIIFKSSSYDYNNNITIFNIINTYPIREDNNIIVFGFLKSGIIEINKNIYWMKNGKHLKYKIKSIYNNSELVDLCNTNQLLTICLYKKNGCCLKNGILTNKKVKSINNIIFEFISDNIILKPINGYCDNKIVHLYNIKKMNNLYMCNIKNYYITDDNYIITNLGLVSVIKKIKKRGHKEIHNQQ
jgi:GTPase